MKSFPFPLTLIGVAIVLTAAVARAQDSTPAGPTSGFSSTYVQVIPGKVATLPACSAALSGARAVVTDALGPTYSLPLVGGGKIGIGALCNGTAWVAD